MLYKLLLLNLFALPLLSLDCYYVLFLYVFNGVLKVKKYVARLIDSRVQFMNMLRSQKCANAYGQQFYKIIHNLRLTSFFWRFIGQRQRTNNVNNEQ